MDYKIRLVRYVYYFSLLGLLVIYLFPGSIIGCFLYGDCRQQPDFIPNPLGTSINHALAFFYLSILGLISYLRDKSFNQATTFLISLSIILELSHYFIPNRSFQFLDLFANLLGTFIAIFMIIIFKKYKRI